MTRPRRERDAVARLLARGEDSRAISRATGIPDSTVRTWKRQPDRRTIRAADCSGQHDVPSSDYAYLFGLYLGDGCIATHPRTYRLRITLDSRYPGIVDECCRAMMAVLPNNRLARIRRADNAVDVTMYSCHWPCLFPQHGPGRKHEREIRLAPWQRKIVGAESRAFLRGLIHSDGCRYVARERGPNRDYEWPRYGFSNLSPEIRKLFCDACDRLDIQWCQGNSRNVHINRRSSVEAMDRFVGPKY